jgi:pSer/pThr/pTyr-binding forkhead associated (FHA) protein
MTPEKCSPLAEIFATVCNPFVSSIPAESTMQITLVLYDSSRKVQEFQFERFPIIIGRSTCADIQLHDRWVSRRHCELDNEQGHLIVRDLDSRHGTLINACPIGEAVLLPGDKLNVGLCEFVASYDVEQSESADLQAAQ